MAMATMMLFGSYGGRGLGLGLGAGWHEDADDRDKRIAAAIVEELANVRVEKVIGLWYQFGFKGVDMLVLFKNAVDGPPWACILHIDRSDTQMTVSKLYRLV